MSRYQVALTSDAAAFLLSRGVSREAAAISRLGVVADPAPGHGGYTGWLALPYLRHDGQAVSIRFRCIDPMCGVLRRRRLATDPKEQHFGHGKYMSLEDEPSRVFYIPAVHLADDEIHVTEGEFDAIILNQVGLPAVAIPGASGWQPHHRRMLAGFSRVWVWGDPDDAGAKFVAKVCRAMRQARGIQLSIGDVTETYLEQGAGGLYALLESERG
ncbi:toprim domain-containing protein [Micromonospora sp. NBC_01813]|uniref:toprim domain-containing protein n=1 Tax=Micromonospora sp. NBC_01813 TaxID=2975988 RepID=UPI002DDA017A|nr:toprim domain-containing protein [Micromonospora sp. NBC_01813]WSA11577.1 toprim domain-containing protein [Micromonospora sp. NBC_01813]